MKTFVTVFSRSVDQQGGVRLLVPCNQTEASQQKGIYVMVRHGKFSVHTSYHANDL